MKKTLSCLLIIAILMNFILCSISYADGSEDGTADLKDSPYIYDGQDDDKKASPSNSIADSLINDGLTSTKNGVIQNVHTNSMMAGPSMIGVIMGYLALIIDIIPLQIQMILSAITFSENTTTTSAGTNTSMDFWITIDKMIFNKVPLFNINYFDSNTEYTVGSGEHEVILKSNGVNSDMKLSISKMFIICRMLAIVISLLVFI